MGPECRCRFILLDFGHPMTADNIKNVINSLENTLSLLLASPRRAQEINFGILILNSEFIILSSELTIQSDINLRKTFDLMTKNLNSLVKKANRRVTVQEYKSLLSNSIKASLHSQKEFEKMKKSGGQPDIRRTQIAIVTKKNASVIAEILSDVVNNLQKTISCITSVKTFKIIRISSEPEKNSGTSDKNSLIKWAFCEENVCGLSSFFKDWLLNRQQQLRILLSKYSDLEVKCDVDDSVITLDLFSDMRLKGSKTLLGISNDFKVNQQLQDVQILFLPVEFNHWDNPTNNHTLEIIHRLPANGLCPTLVFGIPRRVYATASCNFNWTELQINKKIFKELCRELNETGQGLLAKSVSSLENSEIINYHFLTSNGDILLMNDVAPQELYFPKETEDSNVVESCEDESAASLVKSCLRKIQFLSEFTPDNFTSGIYEFLKDSWVKSAQNKSLFGRFDPNIKLFGKKPAKKNSISSSATKTLIEDTEKRKRVKTDAEKELQNVHPALLASNIVEKYRKIHPDAFNLPELGKDYNENLT